MAPLGWTAILNVNDGWPSLGRKCDQKESFVASPCGKKKSRHSVHKEDVLQPWIAREPFWGSLKPTPPPPPPGGGGRPGHDLRALPEPARIRALGDTGRAWGLRQPSTGHSGTRRGGLRNTVQARGDAPPLPLPRGHGRGSSSFAFLPSTSAPHHPSCQSSPTPARAFCRAFGATPPPGGWEVQAHLDRYLPAAFVHQPTSEMIGAVRERSFLTSAGDVRRPSREGNVLRPHPIPPFRHVSVRLGGHVIEGRAAATFLPTL